MSSHAHFDQVKKSYLKVFAALVVLTALTVFVTTMHFGDMLNIVVGVVIAVTKAGMVASIFMHLKFDHARLRYFVMVPAAFFVILVLALTKLGL